MSHRLARTSGLRAESPARTNLRAPGIASPRRTGTPPYSRSRNSPAVQSTNKNQQAKICSRPPSPLAHARPQTFLKAIATGFKCPSSRRAHRKNSSGRRASAPAPRPGRIISSPRAGTGKTGTHARPHRGPSRREQSRRFGTAGHAPSRRIPSAPFHGLVRPPVRKNEKTGRRKENRSSKRRRRNKRKRTPSHHRPTPLPSRAACHRHTRPRPARTSGLRKNNSRQRALESRPLALFRRLVGTRSLVAQRVGHRITKQRPAKHKQHRPLPPGARFAGRSLVRGRHV